MRIWTVHAPPEAPPERGQRAPVLTREGGFAWLAFLFAGLWFLVNRMWLVFVLYLALAVLLGVLLPDRIAPWAAFALQLLVGLSARDLRRWMLERRGWRLAGVVVARDEDAAWARLFAERPDLARAAAA
jgi:hypothetical protein